MKDFVLKAIDTLPPPPQSVIAFNEYKKQHDIFMSHEEMVKLLEDNEEDKQIILKVAHSPIYNISTDADLRRIVNLLGSVSVKNILMAESIKNNFRFDILSRDLKTNNKKEIIKCVCDLSPYGLQSDAFLSDCERELEVISDWLLSEDKQLHTLIPTLMLLKLGIIICAQILILNNLSDPFYNELQRGNFNNLLRVEKKFLGADHIELLEFVMQKYEIDPMLIAGVHYLRTPFEAPEKFIKNAWIFNIVNFLFHPYKGVTQERLEEVLRLLEVLRERGIYFKSALLKSKVSKEYFWWAQ